IRRERVERQSRDRRDRWERLREHADHVTAWIANDYLVVSNGSRHLVHDVCITLSDDRQYRFDHIEPGTTRQALEAPASSGAVRQFRFTDARGHHWRREGGSGPQLIRDAGQDPATTAS